MKHKPISAPKINVPTNEQDTERAEDIARGSNKDAKAYQVTNVTHINNTPSKQNLNKTTTSPPKEILLTANSPLIENKSSKSPILSSRLETNYLPLIQESGLETSDQLSTQESVVNLHEGAHIGSLSSPPKSPDTLLDEDYSDLFHEESPHLEKEADSTPTSLTENIQSAMEEDDTKMVALEPGIRLGEINSASRSGNVTRTAKSPPTKDENENKSYGEMKAEVVHADDRLRKLHDELKCIRSLLEQNAIATKPEAQTTNNFQGIPRSIAFHSDAASLSFSPRTQDSSSNSVRFTRQLNTNRQIKPNPNRALMKMDHSYLSFSPNSSFCCDDDDDSFFLDAPIRRGPRIKSQLLNHRKRERVIKK
jgi:hypothetical protein